MLCKLLPEFGSGIMRDVYNDTLLSLMKDDERIMQIEADLSSSLATGRIRKAYPDRFVNCGVMEAQMVGLACGLSVNGRIPFAHTFAAFLSRRAADQVFMSGCYNRANVKLIGTDPGVIAEANGGTHQCLEDIGIMRVFPEMTVMDIAEPNLLAAILPQMSSTYGMMYLRLARKKVATYYAPGNSFSIGKANLLREGNDVTIITCGICVADALRAADALLAEGIHARVIDMFTIKPLDGEAVISAARETGRIVTVENHNIIGGLGSSVAEALSENQPCRLIRLGARDRFGEVGDMAYLKKVFGITPEDIANACRAAVCK